MDLRKEMIRKMNRWCEIRLNLGTVMKDPPSLQNEYFDTIIITPSELNAMGAEDRKNLKPITNSTDLENHCKAVISKSGADRRIFVQLTRGSDEKFKDLLEEIHNSRNDSTREHRLAMMCAGKFAPDVGVSEEEWFNLACIPSH